MDDRFHLSDMELMDMGVSSDDMYEAEELYTRSKTELQDSWQHARTAISRLREPTENLPYNARTIVQHLLDEIERWAASDAYPLTDATFEFLWDILLEDFEEMWDNNRNAMMLDDPLH